MPGEMPHDENPEFDPIKDAFVEDELLALADHNTQSKPGNGTLADMVFAGELSVEDEATLTVLTDMIKKDQEDAKKEAGKLIAGFVLSSRNTGETTAFSRFFEAAIRDFNETGIELFMPIRYFKDEETNPAGLTIEEWRQLPDEMRKSLIEAAKTNDDLL